MATVKRQNDRRGGVVILETALILPVLLLLTFGAIEYGWMFLKAQETSNAARHGARIAVRADASSADVLTGIASLMTSASLGDSGYTVRFVTGDVASTPAGETVTVEVSVPYQGNISLVGGFLPVPEHLTSSVSMAKEGP